MNPHLQTLSVIACGKGLTCGRGCFVSLRTDAVGHTSTARHAASCSSGVSGCRANTLLPFRPMIRSGATWRDAPQSMHASSMYQSPGAESGLRMGFTREFSGCAPRLHVDKVLIHAPTSRSGSRSTGRTLPVRLRLPSPSMRPRARAGVKSRHLLPLAAIACPPRQQPQCMRSQRLLSTQSRRQPACAACTKGGSPRYARKLQTCPAPAAAARTRPQWACYFFAAIFCGSSSALT